MDTLYIDYQGGKFVSWFYSEGDTYTFRESYDLSAIKRAAKKQFDRFILTDEAKRFARNPSRSKMVKGKMSNIKKSEVVIFDTKEKGVLAVFSEPSAGVLRLAYISEDEFDSMLSLRQKEDLFVGKGRFKLSDSDYNEVIHISGWLKSDWLLLDGYIGEVLGINKEK